MTKKPMTAKNSIDNGTFQQILEMQAEICKAMGHPARLHILELLKENEKAAGDLLGELDISKANLSKHMSMLVQAGIAEQRREGRQVYYRLTHERIHDACSIMRTILYRRLKRGEQLASALAHERNR